MDAFTGVGFSFTVLHECRVSRRTVRPLEYGRKPSLRLSVVLRQVTFVEPALTRDGGRAHAA